MVVKKDDNVKYVLLGLSIIFFLLSVVVIKSYFLPLITALVLAFILNPIYKHLMTIFKSKKLASIFICIFLVIILVGLSIFLINSLTNQAANAYLLASRYLSNSDWTQNTITTYIQERFGFEINIRQIFSGMISSFVGWGQNFVGSLTGRVVNFVVVIFSLFFFLNDKEKLKSGFVKLLPISNDLTKKIINEISNITSALIFGHFVTGVIQGLVAGIGYVLLGVSSPLLWAFLSTVFAWIPLVGPPVVYVPLSLGMFLVGLENNTWYMGVLLLIYGVFVISAIDNFVRPKLVGDRANVHPLVVFFGILGGIAVFGFIGLILGPLILALFFFSLSMYVNYMREEEILQELDKEKKQTKNKKKSFVQILESSFAKSSFANKDKTKKKSDNK